MSRPISDIPRGDLPAQVKATVAYFGVASGYRIDMSLDGEPDIEVIVTATDAKALQRFFSQAGFKDYDPTKTLAVALVKREAVVLSKQEQPKVEDDDEEL